MIITTGESPQEASSKTITITITNRAPGHDEFSVRRDGISDDLALEAAQALTLTIDPEIRRILGSKI